MVDATTLLFKGLGIPRTDFASTDDVVVTRVEKKWRLRERSGTSYAKEESAA